MLWHVAGSSQYVHVVLKHISVYDTLTAGRCLFMEMIGAREKYTNIQPGKKFVYLKRGLRAPEILRQQ